MIASITYVKEVLGDLKAKKKFGQNFLIDANTVDKIARDACCSELKTIEIGPGLGALTEMLLKYSKSVDAYEIDRDMYELLKQGIDDERLSVYLGDFLDVDLSIYQESVNVCANLPYYVTTPILFKLFEYGQRVPYITVMVQKEVAERFTAAPASKEYSALSVEAQYLYTVKKLFNVARTQFDPVPNVDSAVVGFSVHSDIPEDIPVQEFFAFVRDCFKQRRKTLYNNLKEIMDTDRISSILQDAGIEAGRRPQELSVNEYIQLYRSFRREG